MTTRTSTGEKLLLTVEEVAHLLSINRSTVYDMLARGDLPSVKLGRRRLIYRQSLVDFIVRNESDGPLRHDDPDGSPRSAHQRRGSDEQVTSA
jgi:excisionase family DNA binding protein